MVKDGFFYAVGFGLVAGTVWYFTGLIWLAAIPVILALFFLWFFRDPKRTVPVGENAIVSPGDGVVTEADWVETKAGPRLRLSIFLSVFDVHVNRTPVAGRVTLVEHRKGRFLNAMNRDSAMLNEQTLIVIDAGGYEVSFKQIAGLLARRIVCNLKAGDVVARGQRMGLIKFGSRVDVLVPADAELKVRKGTRVQGGATVLAVVPEANEAEALMAQAVVGLMQDEIVMHDGAQRAALRNADGEKTARNPRRGMYVLPSLFTAGNIAAGFYAITQSIQGSAGEPDYFDRAALAIGFAVLFDGIDGRIARMTNTTSDFGKELDSLADVITFGVAPSVLAYIWGFRMLSPLVNAPLRDQILHIGVFVCFLFLICGASRLARFNISVNPKPKNPGRPGRKYFVGMPIPAGAGVLAAVVHFFRGSPIYDARMSILWLGLIAGTGFLMVSSWRFWSGKEINLGDRHPFRGVLILALVGALLVMYSEWLLLVIALGYLVSGVLARLAYSWSRERRRSAGGPA